jgi:four helix bundle protein
MATHRSLVAWQAARDVSEVVFRLCREHSVPYAYGAFRQLQHAALSVQLNIAEGYALWTRRQLLKHLRIAYGSAVETVEILQLLIDQSLIPSGVATPCLERAKFCQAALVGLLKKLQ